MKPYLYNLIYIKKYFTFTNMTIKKLVVVTAAFIFSIAILLLLTSTLWIGWIMEYEHNKTKHVLANYTLQCGKNSIEERDVWSKLGIAIFCKKENVQHGIWEAWDGGYMHISGNYIQGKKHGTWKYYNAYGEQWGEKQFSHGEETSPLINLLIADSVLVEKKVRKLYLVKDDKRYRTYKISLGSESIGHKISKDDKRTPEGLYVLDSRNNDSQYYKSIHITYPNNKDLKNAEKANTDLGDNILIHGQPNNFGWAWRLLRFWDWTNGSIAVNNQDMDEIMEFTETGTPILIKP